MALEHAILVSLSEKPGTGYQLTRRFERSIGFFWSATHQQIYRVLHRMEQLGWVDHTLVAQDGRPDMKVYSITDAGRQELARWFAEPADPEPMRVDLGVKVRAAGQLDPEPLLEELARHRDLHAARLELFREIEQRDFPDPDRLDATATAQHLVLRGGIMIEQSWVDWCEEALRTLRELTRRTRPAAPAEDDRP